jgi:ATP phosphoribosyltransferase
MTISSLNNNGADDGRIKFAIPSVTSRLHKGSAAILNISCLAKNAPLVMDNEELVLFQLRGTDIPVALARGLIDYGLCGLDAVVENQVDLPVLSRFPETTTRIGLIERPERSATPGKNSYSVVTEYPVLTRSHLEQRYPELHIWKVHGSSESFAFLDGIDGVVDIVDTGNTLRQNGLVLREVIFQTCICLVGGPTLDHDEANSLLDRLRLNVQKLAGARG